MRLIGAGTREDIDYEVTDRWFTIPNIITLARFCLVPVFVWLVFTDQNLKAFAVLVLLFCTDWVDGYVARRFNLVSTVGQWLDPVADRISLVVVAATIVVTGLAPWWLALLLVVPDVLLALLSAVLFLGSPEVEVTVLGKIRTALLMCGIPLLLLVDVPSTSHPIWLVLACIFLIPGCIGHVAAALDYGIRAVRKFSRLKAEGIDPRARQQWAIAHQGINFADNVVKYGKD